MESWAYSWFRSKPKTALLPGEIAAAEAEAEAKAAAKAKGGGGLLSVFGRGKGNNNSSSAGADAADADADADAAAAVRSRGRGGARTQVSSERAEFDAAVDDISGSTARLKEMVSETTTTPHNPAFTVCIVER